MNASDKSPTADVYAGDTSSPTTADPREGAICFFNIEADSEPGTFARVANVLNIANVAPSRVILEHKKDDETLSVYIELAVGLSTVHSIQRKLSQLTDVFHADIGVVASNGSLSNAPD
jgi:hypothetical protein